jgi:hypothetical protein
VLCVTHMLVSKYAGTGDEVSKARLCQPDEGKYAWYLILYWVFILVFLPLGLLYRRMRKVQAEAARRVGSTVIPTSYSFQPEPEPEVEPEWQPEPEPEPEPELGPQAVWQPEQEPEPEPELFARSRAASLDSAAGQSDDDGYSSGGEDDPNWRAKRGPGGAE